MKYFALAFLLLMGCHVSDVLNDSDQAIMVAVCSDTAIPESISGATSFLNPDGKTIVTRFNPNQGFEREELTSASFATFLQGFSLNTQGS